MDGDKTLDQLTPEEATDLCEWGLSLLEGDEFERLDCYLEALLSTPDVETCEEAAQECLDNLEPTDPLDGDCTFEDPPACASEVSVAEIEACARDTFALLDDLLDAIDCDFNPEDLEDLDSEQPASCVVVQEKCPELFEDEDDEEEGGDSRARAARWAHGASRAARLVGAANAGL